jgi:hypothetical protein
MIRTNKQHRQQQQVSKDIFDRINDEMKHISIAGWFLRFSLSSLISVYTQPKY